MALLFDACSTLISLIFLGIVFGTLTALALLYWLITRLPKRAAFERLLLAIPAVRGIKYSSYNLFDMRNIIELAPGALTVLSGFDEVCLAGLAMGAHGAIGSTYNVMPATFAALYQAVQDGQRWLACFASARRTTGRSASASMDRSGSLCTCPAISCTWLPSNGSRPLASWQ